jgi:hypothetical protein
MVCLCSGKFSSVIYREPPWIPDPVVQYKNLLVIANHVPTPNRSAGLVLSNDTYTEPIGYIKSTIIVRNGDGRIDLIVTSSRMT